MNVLIITPDAVGSTLLQRLITIYMQFYDFDRPVINLHELTNGIAKYFSPDFNREIVSKSHTKAWGYYQTLQQIVDLLDSVDHYKTSRLAKYHINRRQDPQDQQILFYQYLNENFLIIACRRHNVFEHALSMVLRSITRKFNVYNHAEKFDTFLELSRGKILLDQTRLISALEDYKSYLEWSQTHFEISNYFYYDRDLDNIEEYVLQLPIFHRFSNKVTWRSKFGIGFDDWNRCHHIPSDLSSMIDVKLNQALQIVDHGPADQIVRLYQQESPSDWPAISNADDLSELPQTIKDKFLHTMSQSLPELVFDDGTVRYYQHHKHNYNQACQAIKKMQELDIIVTPPPIKKQTLQDKIHAIKNWQQCLETYNDWVSRNPDIGSVLDATEIERQISKEKNYWKNFKSAIEAKSYTQGILKLRDQNDDHL